MKFMVAAAWLTALLLVFAASASADCPSGAEGSGDQHVTNDEPSDAEASEDSPEPSPVPDTPSPQDPQDPSAAPPDHGNVVWPWPWLQSDGDSHDKCKRRRPHQVPLWCSGLSSWPIRNAPAGTERHHRD